VFILVDGWFRSRSFGGGQEREEGIMGNNKWCCLLGVNVARTPDMLLITVGLLLIEIMIVIDLPHEGRDDREGQRR